MCRSLLTLALAFGLSAAAFASPQCVARKTLRTEHMGSNEVTSQTSETRRFGLSAYGEGRHAMPLGNHYGKAEGSADVYLNKTAEGHSVTAYFDIDGKSHGVTLELSDATPFARAVQAVNLPDEGIFSNVYLLTIECSR